MNIQINLPLLQTSLNLFNQVLFPTWDLKRNCVIIPNDWKHRITKETSQKPPSRFPVLATAFLGKEGISNKEIHFILQSDKTKQKPFNKFISRANFMEEYQNCSPGIWGKIFTD